MTELPELRHWVTEQVGQFVALRPHYTVFAETLERVIHDAVLEIAPLAIVQVRVKSVSSYAEKVLRKRDKHPDPVHQFTDLCGARVIGRTRAEVDALCDWAVQHFEIDWENSADTSQRLAPTEFGYRSVHYIVSFRDGVDYGTPIPPECEGLRAEMQLRTVAEHAYCDFAHDLTYKGAFTLPVAWQRELAGVAATLEEVDGVFVRIEEGLREYASAYGRHLSSAQLDEELERLEIVLEHDASNVALADRLATLASQRGDWAKVVSVLEPVVGEDEAQAGTPVLRNLGIALCQVHRDSPRGESYRRGQDLLEAASRLDDVDAICALAETWKELDVRRARDLYRRAFELDSADPNALGNYLELELDRAPAVLESVRPLLRQGVARCHRHLDAGINLPWALYDLGRFHLLLGEPYLALGHYAHALSVTDAPFMAEAALRSLEQLAPALGGGTGVEWARMFLLLGLAARFPSEERVDRVRALATQGASPLRGPIVIVAGGTDPRVQARMATYYSLLERAFDEFEGTILSGGTTEGVSGLAGRIGQTRGDAVRVVGYLPQLIPADATVDARYDELRHTGGREFSPLEPLQNWVDLLSSGISPRDVRLIGINGGRIAATEYRVALALGASVGLVADSGREAGRLVSVQRWLGDRPLRLPPDAAVLRAFLGPRPPRQPEPLREQLARSIHESYRRERLRSGNEVDLALSAWPALPEGLRSSNLRQADDIVHKLEKVGCVVVAADSPGEEAVLSEEEIELLAEMEHGRWTVERLLGGWSWDEERDPAHHTSPYLVEWSLLPEDIKQLDRQAVQAIPGVLASAGLGIRRTPGLLVR